MAISTVDSRYKGFIFAGENCRNYGVYVTDVKVFGAPTRDVEMVTIPGRNGDFVLDKGHFNNIEVVYTCAMGAGTESDFVSAISDFRNVLASKKGYQTLTDEINTGESRQAEFKDGLDVPTLNKKTGTFEVKFNCKPQRWLDTGKTAVSVANNGTITNPTKFDASPIIEFKGYTGTNGIVIGSNDPIRVNNAPYGLVLLSNAVTQSAAKGLSTTNLDLMYTGDVITVEQGGGQILKIPKATSGTTIDSVSGSVSGDITGNVIISSGTAYTADMVLDEVTFVKGTTATKNISLSLTVGYTTGGTPYTYTGTLSYTFKYDASGKTVAFAYTGASPSIPAAISIGNAKGVFHYPDIYGNSTKVITTGTIKIDLDLGEAYTESGGVITSVNNIVELPAELPTLAPGSNTITYDNTITSFKVTPRWWKV